MTHFTHFFLIILYFPTLFLFLVLHSSLFSFYAHPLLMFSILRKKSDKKFFVRHSDDVVVLCSTPLNPNKSLPKNAKEEDPQIVPVGISPNTSTPRFPMIERFHPLKASLGRRRITNYDGNNLQKIYKLI